MITAQTNVQCSCGSAERYFDSWWGWASIRGLPSEVRPSPKLTVTGSSLDTERTEESSRQGTGCAKALWLERPGKHEGLEDTR